MQRAALVVLFWLAAAMFITAIHAGAITTTATIFAAAYAYTRLAARNAGVTHALTAGSAWLVLSMTTELAVTERLGHGWYALLGSPDRPLTRNLLLFVWIFAPLVFAHART